jgi:hypothetical protein
MPFRTTLVVVASALSFAQLRADEEPKMILEKAIHAHGGQEKLALTLKGRIKAKAKGTSPPNLGFSVTWEETFELPSKYKRLIDGEFNDKPFSLEYSVINGNGWIRKN